MHLKNVGRIRHNEPPHAHSADVASGTVARRLRIDVYDNANDDDNDNAWQRGPLWLHGMGPVIKIQTGVDFCSPQPSPTLCGWMQCVSREDRVVAVASMNMDPVVAQAAQMMLHSQVITKHEVK